MKVAHVRCKSPSCGTIYEEPVEDSETMVKCPVCSQVNSIDEGGRQITGRCQQCNRPLDDHTRGECPPKEKK